MSTRERLTNLYEQYLKKTPRQSRSRSVVEAILRGALERLARSGDAESLRVDEIAARAGVGVGSVYDYFPDRERLLASALAKVTEDNLLKFEALLVRVRSMPLRDAIGAVVDLAFETYLANPILTRSFVRLANANDLFPVLVHSQNTVAKQLAADLARREEVVVETDAAAWLLTNTLMGAVLAVVWDDDAAMARERVRTAYVDMAYAYLTTRPA